MKIVDLLVEFVYYLKDSKKLGSNNNKNCTTSGTVFCFFYAIFAIFVLCIKSILPATELEVSSISYVFLAFYFPLVLSALISDCEFNTSMLSILNQCHIHWNPKGMSWLQILNYFT